ncbi:hypothetical protein C8R46DRAFT_1213114 [Mycena filopes]|nr:hypothetical protein C8R46DRAFT_1213114 [Mycena filopes]
MGKDDAKILDSDTVMEVDSLIGDVHDDNKDHGQRDVEPEGLDGGELANHPADVSWVVHEPIGAVVCASTLGALRSAGGVEIEDGETDELEVTEACSTCLAYCKHIGAGLICNDAVLEATMKLRDVKVAANARGNDLAMIQGELVGARREADKLSERIVALTEKLVDVSADNAVLAKERDRYLYERDDADDRATEWRRRADDAEREITRLDDSRARKRITPQHSGTQNDRQTGSTSGQSSESAASVSHSSTEDVAMREVRIIPSMEWGKLSGVPKWSTEYAIDDARQLPPTHATDFPLTDGKYASIAAWEAALRFSHASRCWPVALYVFRAYWEARAAVRKNEALSEFQRYVLENYTIPEWFYITWKEWTMDAEALQANRQFWANTSSPRTGSVRELAAWIQKGGHQVGGVPFVDDYGTVSSRNVRGLDLFRSLNVCDKTGSMADREKALRINLALLRVFAIPFCYELVVFAEAMEISPIAAYEHWPIGAVDDLSRKFVASRLAAMGVTLAVANNAWAFATDYLESLLNNPRSGWDVAALQQIRVEAAINLEGHGTPLALEEGCVFIPRVPGLPWADGALNRIQDDGIFLENIPTKPSLGSTIKGRVTCPREGQNQSSPTVSNGLPRGGAGGFRARGRGYNRGAYRGRGGPPVRYDPSLAGSMHAPWAGHAPAMPPPPPPPSQSQQRPALLPLSPPPPPPSHAAAPFTVPQGMQLTHHTSTAPTPSPAAAWPTTVNPAALTFGAIPAQSRPTAAPAPSQITVAGQVYHLGAPAAAVESTSTHPNTTNYHFTTTTDASAFRTGLVGTPMTELYHALPPHSADNMASYDTTTFNGNGAFGN